MGARPVTPRPPASGLVADFRVHDPGTPCLRDSRPRRFAPLGSRFCFRQVDPGAGPRHHDIPMPSASGGETVKEQPTGIWARGIPENSARVDMLMRARLAELRQELAASGRAE